jgi:putative spermidine/putrescine transport system ATP-binding protein
MGFRNLLQGEVVEVHPEGVVVETGTLRLLGTPVGTVAQGDRVVAAVRPTDFEISEPGAADGIRAVVEVVEYQGREQAAEARTESGERLHLRSDRRLAPGDAVSLSVPTERLLVYPLGDEAPPSSSPLLGETSPDGVAPALAGRG